MAPIELFPASRYVDYLPTALIASHFLAIGYLSTVVVHTIFRSYAALPPSSNTRYRQPSRKTHVKTFTALAAISLLSVFVYGMKFGSLSYQVWATERAVELPEDLFGDKGAFRLGQHPGRIQIARWLYETPLYRDALEIVAETARFSWWAQQLNVSVNSWSVYLALEGQRRNISNLWAFLALAQLVGLSYAQNLFFLAVLLTPVPLPGNVRDLTRSSVPATSTWYSRVLENYFPTKPEGFLPKPGFYLGLLIANIATTFLVPIASNTPSFMDVAMLSKTLPFSFLVLPYIIPDRWGQVHTLPHSAHSTYLTLFRMIAYSSFALHSVSSGVALFKNTPDSTYYRHSLLRPLAEESRSTLDRTTTAFSRVLGAIWEHPAVTAVGLDVILSGLTLGTWAGIRGLDARDMCASSMPFINTVAKVVEETASEATETLSEIKDHTREATESVIAKVEATPRKRGRHCKVERKENAKYSSMISGPRRRGRPSKKSITEEVKGEDPSYEPDAGADLEEGDDNNEEGWEAAALAWGLISAGGLAVGSAAVYGAEVLAR